MPSVNHHTRVTGERVLDETILGVDIGDDAVGSAELASGAVAYSNQIANDRVGSEHIANNAIGSSAMVADDVIGSEHLAAGAVVAGVIADDSIGSQHLANNAVSYGAQIKDGTIGSAELGSDAVYSAKVADDAIGSEHISDAAVISARIADDAVGSQHLGNNAISYAAQVKDNTIGYSELTSGLQGSLAPSGGTPSPDTVGTTQLKEPGVGSQNIYSDAVYGAKIADDAIGSEHIENNALSYAAQIKDGIIGSTELADGAVSLNKLLYVPSMGTIANVTATGLYRSYYWGQLGEGTLEYSIAPAVVVTPVGTINAVLDHTPALGSFKVKLVAAGTEIVHYLSLGYVAR